MYLCNVIATQFVIVWKANSKFIWSHLGYPSQFTCAILPIFPVLSFPVFLCYHSQFSCAIIPSFPVLSFPICPIDPSQFTWAILPSFPIVSFTVYLGYPFQITWDILPSLPTIYILPSLPGTSFPVYLGYPSQFQIDPRQLNDRELKNHRQNESVADKTVYIQSYIQTNNSYDVKP